MDERPVPSHLLAGTNPDLEQESSNKTSKQACSHSQTVEGLGVSLCYLAEPKAFRFPARGSTGLKPSEGRAGLIPKPLVNAKKQK